MDSPSTDAGKPEFGEQADEAAREAGEPPADAGAEADPGFTPGAAANVDRGEDDDDR